MVKWYDENTLVIKTKNIDKIRDFLSFFGLKFISEKHGDGPEHYSCTSPDGKVLEIYPTRDQKVEN